MKTVAQTVIEADRFYTIAAHTGNVIQAVEASKDGGTVRLGKYDHKPEQEWSFVRVGEGSDTYRSTFVYLTDVALIYVCHYPYILQSGDGKHLIVLVRTYLHLFIDILFYDKTGYRGFHQIKRFSGKMIDGEDLRDSLFFCFSIA